MAFYNLISNAVKYSKTEKIDVILSKKFDKTELVVRDYGVGIEKEHLNNIFERFYRINKNRRRKLGEFSYYIQTVRGMGYKLEEVK